MISWSIYLICCGSDFQSTLFTSIHSSTHYCDLLGDGCKPIFWWILVVRLVLYIRPQSTRQEKAKLAIQKCQRRRHLGPRHPNGLGGEFWLALGGKQVLGD